MKLLLDENISAKIIKELLLTNFTAIKRFVDDPEEGLLVLETDR